MSNLITIVLKEFSSTALTGSYQNFGSVMASPGIKVQFYNNSTVDVYITDGTSVWHLPLKSSWFGDETFTDNSQEKPKFYLAKGAQLQIKQVTGVGTGTSDIIAHIVTDRS